MLEDKIKICYNCGESQGAKKKVKKVSKSKK